MSNDLQAIQLSTQRVHLHLKPSSQLLGINWKCSRQRIEDMCKEDCMKALKEITGGENRWIHGHCRSGEHGEKCQASIACNLPLVQQSLEIPTMWTEFPLMSYRATTWTPLYNKGSWKMMSMILIRHLLEEPVDQENNLTWWNVTR